MAATERLKTIVPVQGRVCSIAIPPSYRNYMCCTSSGVRTLLRRCIGGHCCNGCYLFSPAQSPLDHRRFLRRKWKLDPITTVSAPSPLGVAEPKSDRRDHTSPWFRITDHHHNNLLYVILSCAWLHPSPPSSSYQISALPPGSVENRCACGGT